MTNISFRMRRTISILGVLLLFCFCDSRSSPVITHVGTQNNGSTAILLIGSSYFSYNQFPMMFLKLVQSGGKDVMLDWHIPNGRFLDFHATDSVTDAKIKEKKWDYVFLQSACTVMAFPETHDQIFPPYIKHPIKWAVTTLRDKIAANCDSTITVFTMPWAFEDGTTWLAGYDDTYAEMQEMVYDNTLEMMGELNVKIAPVGWAWYYYIMGGGDLRLFMHDYNHPSTAGSYLMACVFYACLFHESPEGLTFHAGLGSHDAERLQKIAAETVLADWEKWGLKKEF